MKLIPASALFVGMTVLASAPTHVATVTYGFTGLNANYPTGVALAGQDNWGFVSGSSATV